MTDTGDENTNVEFEECPDCGRVGLPERIEAHSC